MQITVTGRGLEITAPLRDYVHEKIGKFEEFFGNIQKAEVVLEARSTENVDKRQVAEIRVWVAGMKMFQALEAGQDLYAAVDLVVKEMERQLERHKKMHVQEHRRHAGMIKHGVTESHEADEAPGQVLIKLNRFAKKPMSLDEAREELKVMGQDFLAFRNTDTNEVNVIRQGKGKIELLRADKELLPEEAVEMLQKSNEDLIVFNNKSTRIPSVVFRRKSGNFGLIESEL